MPLYNALGASFVVMEGADKAEEFLGKPPLKRIEANLQNIRKPQYIILEFSASRSEQPINIKTLEASLTKLNQKAAISAIEGWQYLPAFKKGKFSSFDGVCVRFTVEPPRKRR